MSRFLIIRTGALGDIVHGIPVAAALKKAFPFSRIDWIAEEHYEGLIRCVPFVDACIPVPIENGARRLADARFRERWSGTFRRLRHTSYSISIDLQGLIRSGAISFLSGAPMRLGFPREHCREWPNRLFSTHRPVRVPSRSHVIDRNLSLLHPLGVREKQPCFDYRVPEDVQHRIEKYVAAAAPNPAATRIAVHPVAGWPTKEWRAERFAQLVERLTRDSKAREVFLLWGPGERDRVEGIRSRLGPTGHVHMVPFMGLTELVSFLRRCDLYVGGDSGPLHLACSLDIPVLGLFGPTDPVRNGPFQGSFRVVLSCCSCAPCYKRRCIRTDCMDAICVDEVWNTLIDFEPSLERGKALREQNLS